MMNRSMKTCCKLEVPVRPKAKMAANRDALLHGVLKKLGTANPCQAASLINQPVLSLLQPVLQRADTPMFAQYILSEY